MTAELAGSVAVAGDDLFDAEQWQASWAALLQPEDGFADSLVEIPDWEDLDTIGPADESPLAVCCRQDAHESIEAAWRMVLDDEPLPEAINAAACHVFLAGGAQGIAWTWVAFNTDPREAIAAVLDESDPRRQLFLKSAQAARETGEPTYEFGHGRTGTRREMVRWEERAIRWLKRAGRRRPAPRGCRPRSRSRRSCRTSRGPPGDDPDEPADLAVPVRREAA